MMPRLLAAILWLCCLLVSIQSLAEEMGGDIALQPGYGYLLLPIIGTTKQRIGKFDLTNVDTGAAVKTISDLYEAAGPSAWMCMVAMPEGRYYWSKCEPEYRHVGLWRTADDLHLLRLFTRDEPSTASDTFEIAAGVINYAGDWEIIVTPPINNDAPYRLSVDTNLNIETLRLMVERYPVHANKYEIYISMMGREALSIVDFQKIVEQSLAESE